MAEVPLPVDPSSYISEGESKNEVRTVYQHGGAAHQLRVLHRVSPDIMVAFASRVYAFNLKTKSEDELAVVPRSTKNLILKDGR